MEATSTIRPPMVEIRAEFDSNAIEYIQDELGYELDSVGRVEFILGLEDRAGQIDIPDDNFRFEEIKGGSMVVILSIQADEVRAVHDVLRDDFQGTVKLPQGFELPPHPHPRNQNLEKKGLFNRFFGGK